MGNVYAIGFLVYLFFQFSVTSGETICQREEIDRPSKVVLTHVLFRSGESVPDKSYPKDPNKNPRSWPAPFGQLTKQGKRQMLELGRFLRYRYGRLLREEYVPRDIYAVSVDADRAIASAQLVLTGLYPPTRHQVWDHHITKWQPIPVHTIPAEEDLKLNIRRQCRKHEELLLSLKEAPEYKKVARDFSKMLETLTANGGRNVTCVEDIDDFYHVLSFQVLTGMSFPSWVGQVFPQPLSAAMAFRYALPTFAPQMEKFRSGPLLQEMVCHMRNKSRRSLFPDRKAFLYAADSEPLIALLRSLGHTDCLLPPHGAAAMVELRKNVGQYEVQVFYKGTSESGVQRVKLPGADSCSVPLEAFVKLTRSKVTDDLVRDCQVEPTRNFECEPGAEGVTAPVCFHKGRPNVKKAKIPSDEIPVLSL